MMKSITKFAGLCLVAVAAMAMSMAATASAGVWQQCTEGTEKVLPTKYTEHLCVTAAAGNAGKWQWNEVTGTEEVKIKGSLLLKDTKVPIFGESEVECYGEGTGDIGPGKYDRIKTITVLNCRGIKVCKAVGVTAAARNLPWQTELYQTEGKTFDALIGTVSGKEAGWKIECEGPVGKSEDECLAEGQEELAMTNKQSSGTVTSTFTQTRNAKCSLGGAGAGKVFGSTQTSKANGWAIRVS
jgi:hypothetical protein